MEQKQKQDRTTTGPEPDPTDDPVRLIVQQFNQLLAIAAQFLNLHADMVRVRAYKGIAHAALLFLAVLLSSAFVVYAGVQVMQGTAGALNTLFGTDGWPGTLVTGLSFLMILFGGWYVFFTKARSDFRNKLRDKYEQSATAHLRRNDAGHRNNGRAVRIPVSGEPDAHQPAGHGGFDHGP